ncbi:LPXTG cell wall anchor domain-containing protein [Streptomyces pimonensis]|uniref:LPXTG cell wall anchor domain-containing protein n=1 Tax=Streptomyces pimonensis TaxID=2860288 RepID=A0ABV4J6V8_9ACTN
MPPADSTLPATGAARTVLLVRAGAGAVLLLGAVVLVGRRRRSR